MKKITAQIITTILDPIVVTGFAVTIIATNSVEATDRFAAFMFLLLGGLLPTVVLTIEYYNTKVNRLVDRNERNSVFTAAFLSFALVTVLFASQTYSNRLWYLIAASTSIYFGLTLLTNYVFDKVSQHAGIFIFWVLILSHQVDMRFGLLIFLLPVVIWTRLELKKHTWVQLMWGTVIGTFAALLTWPW